jgi:hypothetical protein
LALRVGYVGPWEEGDGPAGDYLGDRADPGWTRAGCPWLRRFGGSGVRLTTNLELVRTGGI